jgi:hypothetical protein
VSSPSIGDGKAEALVSLDEICQLLQAHPDFRESPAARVTGKSPAGLTIGRFIKNLRLRNFGAEFARSLTLWHFEIRQERPRLLALDFRWHVEKLRDDWWVFVHFVDSSGEIRFRGDYPLRGVLPDLLGFVYSHRLVVVPGEAPRGNYQIRLGVWSPTAASHLELTQFRGCQRDPTDWCGNGVILGIVIV